MGDYVGQRLGGYLLLEPLGQGGMGAVYLAQHEVGGFRRAIKIQTLSTDARRERFAREARALAKVDQHRGVVGIHEHGLIGEQPAIGYAVMDLVEGHTLGQLLRQGEVPLEQTLRVGAALAEALAHVHAAGITHRDLKPENVLMTQAGEPVLTDFGLARDEEEERMTASGQLMGTMLYMSPEQAAGKRTVGPPSDVFSFGVVLYEMLAGDRPFKGTTPFEVLRQIASSEPESLHLLRSEIPPELARLVTRAMTKDPEGRPTAAALAVDLARIARGESFPRRAPRVVGVVAVVLVVLITLALVRAKQPSESVLPEQALNGTPAPQAPSKAFRFVPMDVGVTTRLRCRFEQSYRSTPARQILVLELVTEGSVVKTGKRSTVSGRVSRVKGRVTDLRNDLQFDSAYPDRTSGTARLVVGDALGLVGRVLAVTFTHNGPPVDAEGLPPKIRIATAEFDPGIFVRRRLHATHGCFPIPLTGATSWPSTSKLLFEHGTRVVLEGQVQLNCHMTRTGDDVDVRFEQASVEWGARTPSISSFKLSGGARIRDGLIKGGYLELTLSGRHPSDGLFQLTSRTEYEIEITR